jgi:hypothetical protein
VSNAIRDDRFVVVWPRQNEPASSQSLDLDLDLDLDLVDLVDLVDLGLGNAEVEHSRLRVLKKSGR